MLDEIVSLKNPSMCFAMTCESKESLKYICLLFYQILDLLLPIIPLQPSSQTVNPSILFHIYLSVYVYNSMLVHISIIHTLAFGHRCVQGCITRTYV